MTNSNNPTTPDLFLEKIEELQDQVFDLAQLVALQNNQIEQQGLLLHTYSRVLLSHLSVPRSELISQIEKILNEQERTPQDKAQLVAQLAHYLD